MKISEINLDMFTQKDIEELTKSHGKALEAGIEHVKRQTRENHPDGTFDDGGRFYLSEDCSCCSSIRPPSRAFPYSHMSHGRSVEHCAELLNSDLKDVKSALKDIKQISKKYA